MRPTRTWLPIEEINESPMYLYAMIIQDTIRLGVPTSRNQWERTCLPFRILLMMTRRPPSLDMRFSHPCVLMRFVSLARGKWFRTLVLLKMVPHRPPGLDKAPWEATGNEELEGNA